MDSTAGERLLVVLEQLVRFLRQVTGDLGPATSSALSRLWRDGPQRLTELARAEGISQPGMTQLVDRMEREGLVRRTASADDRRGVVVEVTEAGLDRIRLRRGERVRALQQMIDALDPGDRAAITSALPAFTRLIGAQVSG